jgi:hypothetical protein
VLPFLCWFVFIIDIIENNLHTFVHAEDSVLGISTWHVLAHPEIVSLKIPQKNTTGIPQIQSHPAKFTTDLQLQDSHHLKSAKFPNLPQISP